MEIDDGDTERANRDITLGRAKPDLLRQRQRRQNSGGAECQCHAIRETLSAPAEAVNVISPLGVQASLKALEDLSTGDLVERVALSTKLEQLNYEATKAFEQYDVVDARNRLVAGELERRWNAKLEEIHTVKQRLTTLDENKVLVQSAVRTRE